MKDQTPDLPDFANFNVFWSFLLSKRFVISPFVDILLIAKNWIL